MACNSELPVQVLVRNLLAGSGQRLGAADRTPGYDGGGDGRDGGSGDPSKNAADLSSPDANDELEPPMGLMDTTAEMESGSDILFILKQ
ncbi:hypothetical protein BT93_L3496 [Corymbia citriodora subsp. variegata]|uniref:Uncharacterized protein n=1 Tax=Corymbia citriodora subsp. variegata TaxID=360336 RepID=A0A8T0CVF9_CORYI|nr:hypothetical protein BT93_L3496 [Corymbia citriodora subsp. variegata]